jgi:hypothetical protein
VYIETIFVRGSTGTLLGEYPPSKRPTITDAWDLRRRSSVYIVTIAATRFFAGWAWALAVAAALAAINPRRLIGKWRPFICFLLASKPLRTRS